MSTLPTVSIKVDKTADNPDGVVIINESDFDEKIHEKATESSSESSSESTSATAEEAEVKVEPAATPWSKPSN